MGRPEKTPKAEDNHSPEKAFGITLRKIRREQGLSQQWLADKSGYHRTYIGLLELGHKSPSLRTIFNLAMTLRIKPTALLTGVEKLADNADKKAGKR
jgi:transcriptional regulator with XRE-family HTH domain